MAEPNALLAAIEAKLAQVDHMVDEGVLEWTDEDAALLDAWREARGEAGKTATWEWWAKLAGDHDFEFSASTREGAIREARAENPGRRLIVVEARYWTDAFRVEDGRFADTRNREHVPVTADEPDPL